MNFTQIEVLEKKKLIATLLGIFEESPHGRISDLLTHLIKKRYADIGTTRVIVLYSLPNGDVYFDDEKRKLYNLVSSCPTSLHDLWLT